MKSITKKFIFSTEQTNKTIRVEMTLKYDSKNRPVFSASCGLYNSRIRDYEYCGQSFDSLQNEDFKNKEDKILFNKIYELWKRNHLNDLNAGTEQQTRAIKEWENKGNKYNYSKVVEYLKNIGYYEVDIKDDDGNIQKYKYGHKWLYRSISNDDLKNINDLLL